MKFTFSGAQEEGSPSVSGSLLVFLNAHFYVLPLEFIKICLNAFTVYAIL